MLTGNCICLCKSTPTDINKTHFERAAITSKGLCAAMYVCRLLCQPKTLLSNDTSHSLLGSVVCVCARMHVFSVCVCVCVCVHVHTSTYYVCVCVLCV